MKNLVIFDLGETLVFYEGLALDWSEHYGSAIAAACRHCSIGYSSETLERASSILFKYNTRRNPRAEEIRADQIFAEVLINIGAGEKNLSEFIYEFFKYFQRKTAPEKTSIGLLAYLKSRGITTAVLTDVPYGMPNEFVYEDLRPFGKYLDCVVTSVDSGYRKPSTRGLQIILDKFNCINSDAVLVGNEKKDVDAAKGLGVFSVVLCPSGEYPPWNQDKSITNLSELKNFIDK